MNAAQPLGGAHVEFDSLTSEFIVNGHRTLERDGLFTTNSGYPRVAAFGQQKNFHCRGSIKLSFNWRRPIHIADIDHGQL